MRKLIITTLLTLTASAALMATDPKGDKTYTKDSSAVGTYTPPSTLAINTDSYNTAIGIRGAGTSGLTIKHFTQNSRAIEGILGFYPNAFSVTVLVEQYVNAFDTPGLNWYYGAGGHVAATNNKYPDREYWGYRRDDGDVGLGVDGIIGMEYKIREIPFAISLDVKPFLEVTTSGNVFLALDPGIGVKVTF